MIRIKTNVSKFSAIFLQYTIEIFDFLIEALRKKWARTAEGLEHTTSRKVEHSQFDNTLYKKAYRNLVEGSYSLVSKRSQPIGKGVVIKRIITQILLGHQLTDLLYPDLLAYAPTQYLW